MFTRLISIAFCLAATSASASEFLADFEDVQDFAHYGPGAWAQQLIQGDPQRAHSGTSYITSWAGEENFGVSVDYTHPDLPWVFESGWFWVGADSATLYFSHAQIPEFVTVEIPGRTWTYVELNLKTKSNLAVNVNLGADILLRADDLSFTLPGDTDTDFDIDLDDLNNVRNNFGTVGTAGDGNGDGAVDLNDLNDVRNGFGGPSNVSVPEPASMTLLYGGCIALCLTRFRTGVPRLRANLP